MHDQDKWRNLEKQKRMTGTNLAERLQAAQEEVTKTPNRNTSSSTTKSHSNKKQKTSA
jgi:hypothetical protein